MSENCCKCKFWKQRERQISYAGYNLDESGKCRRRAPESNVVADRWPTTKADDWCGEFEEKKI